MKRRSLLAALPLAAATGCSASTGTDSTPGATGSDAGGGITITDALGRTITLPGHPQRILLGESRHLYTLLPLQKDDPTAKVVGWGNDIMKAAPDMWSRVRKAAPAADDIPVIGSLHRGDLTVENVLALKPDAAVFTLDSYEAARSSSFFDTLEKAGVPSVIVDYRLKPVDSTRVSIRALGALFDREAEADAFLAHYDGIVNPILEAAKTVKDAPTVFHWRSPGISEPGRTYGDANFGQITDASGGHNIGSDLLPGDEGTLSTEQLLKSQPEVIITSGGEWQHQKISEKAHTAYVHLGYDATPEQARSSLAALAEEPGYDQLQAFRDQKVFGIYHQFYNAPFNFLVFQAFAAWQGLPGHTDVDLDASWKELHEKFMPFPATGTVAIGLADR